MSVISVVVPVFNEQHNIGPLIDKLQDQFFELAPDLEIIFIDDGSTDETWDQIRRAQDLGPVIRARRLSRNFGKEAAVAAGLGIAQGDAVIVMDGDLQHPIYLIPRMIELWDKEGYQVVEGVKTDRGEESYFYRVLSGFVYAAITRLSGFKLNNASDFKLMDRKVVDEWQSLHEVNLFFRGMSAWLGFRRTEVPFDVSPREHGTSGWSIWALIKLALTGLTAFSAIPLRIVSILGVLFTCLATVLGVLTIINKFSGAPVDGFTILVLLNLLIGGLLMISLGIIGEYVGRIYDESKRRPRYVIDKEFQSTSGGRSEPPPVK